MKQNGYCENFNDNISTSQKYTDNDNKKDTSTFRKVYSVFIFMYILRNFHKKFLDQKNVKENIK